MTLLEQLANAPDLFEATLRDFPPALVNWTPPDWEAAPAEHFSALGTMCHLRDIEVDGYHVRLRRVAVETEPDLASVDGYALAVERKYAEESLERVVAEFRAARRVTLAYVSAWATEYERTATFAEYGRLSGRGLLQLLASHDLQHLSGLRWLLARGSALK
ncbi:MAG: DinB family protein [Deltaproteobacteria bacterium]|nr:DinB family protein [Deltaproteobacteria bacterium]